MNFTDIKIYLFSSLSLTISMSNIDLALKIVLLLVTIGYTLTKWFLMMKKNDKKF